MKQIFRKAKFIISLANYFFFVTKWLLIGMPESSGVQIRRFPCRYNSITFLHDYTSPGGWTIGPLVAVVRGVVLRHRHYHHRTTLCVFSASIEMIIIAIIIIIVPWNWVVCILLWFIMVIWFWTVVHTTVALQTQYTSQLGILTKFKY
jgi:hypothetical protein